MLKLSALNLMAGARVIFSSAHLDLPMGSVIAVLGPNAIGKSTLLNCLSGLTCCTPSSLYLRDEDVYQMPAYLRAQRIASIGQHDTAPLTMLACDRIEQGLYPRRKSLFGKEAESKTLSIAAELQIQPLLSQPLFALSGGQRKRVHIARALVDDKADVYILDEPDAGLDEQAREMLMALLRSKATQRKLVIVSLHQQELARRWADEVINLRTDLRVRKPCLENPQRL